MASLNTSSNGPNITRSYQNVVNSPPPSNAQASSPTYGQWAVFAVAAPLVSAFQGDGGKESVLKVQSTGGMFNFWHAICWPGFSSSWPSAEEALRSLEAVTDPLFGQAWSGRPAWALHCTMEC
jgi:hypothetical protein